MPSTPFTKGNETMDLIYALLLVLVVVLLLAIYLILRDIGKR
jgi:hypothetical protein